MNKDRKPQYKFNIGQLVIRHGYQPYLRDLGIVISRNRYVYNLPEYEIYWTIEAASEWLTQYELDGSLYVPYTLAYTVVQEGQEYKIDLSWDDGGEID
jgi:hypothetical protein|tara:strand:- start:4598 stop:4891 length:294 start_codon:yes stop_codon:yes gene_type:complete